MTLKTVINPTTANLDLIGGDTNTGGVTIPEVSSDPASPTAESAWVLKTGSAGSGGGMPYGLLLTLTKPNSAGTFNYQFSYRTQEGTTKRATLS